jgi:hypothetical protein
MKSSILATAAGCAVLAASAAPASANHFPEQPGGSLAHACAVLNGDQNLPRAKTPSPAPIAQAIVADLFFDACTPPPAP